MNIINNPKATKDLRKKLRKRMTKSEVALWSKLKNQQLGYKFRRQHGIGKYIVDFYCHELKLIIELDGISHLSDDVYKKDLERQKFLEDNGYTVKRYTDNQVVNDIESVLKDSYYSCLKINKE